MLRSASQPLELFHEFIQARQVAGSCPDIECLLSRRTTSSGTGSQRAGYYLHHVCPGAAASLTADFKTVLRGRIASYS